MQNIYLFLTIIKKSDEKEFVEFFLRKNVCPVYSSLCRGSTTSETLDLLGLEHSEKVLMQALVSTSKMYELKNALTYEMKIDLPDRGIALAIPLTSIASKRVLDHILAEQSTAEENHITTERKIEMELIVTICIKGNSNAIMQLAKEAGAAGGTIMKAKGTASESDKFFGVTLSDEKEIIYIVAKKETKPDIMKAIASYTNDFGTHPLVFSLPVTETAGFRLLEK
ncbi:MAG: P-II family nitrogen regulator [Clostridia bacterium]|nr:P-II family nitrogen regulator [Clostridia bacterium]MBR4031582.1 P-II family nitrogen regulator [Clostridia bacterium]